MLEADDRSWIIEKRQLYCFDDEKIFFFIDKKNIVLQFLNDLKHYHDNDKRHRDIKSENVLLQLVEYFVENLNKCWCVVKYIDHDEMMFTDRFVKKLIETSWFCASEILNEKRYNEMTNIFSLDVLFLYTFTKYNLIRDRRIDEMWSLSSAFVEQWMKKVDRIIEKKCHSKYQIILKEMLLRNSEARWFVNKCLNFMLKLNQSQMHDQIFSIDSKLFWTIESFTAKQIKVNCKRKYQVIECDNVIKSDDENSDDKNFDDRKFHDRKFDDAKTIISITSHSSNDFETDFDQFNDSIRKNDVSMTLQLSCTTQSFVTSCREIVEKDALSFAVCTSIFNDRDTNSVVRRVTDQTVIYDFQVNWDWNDSEKVNNNDLFQTSRMMRWAITKSFVKSYRRINSVNQLNNSSSQRRSENVCQTELQSLIFDWRFNSYSRNSCSITIKRVVTSQKLIENMSNAILHARNNERSKESNSLISDIMNSADFARQIKSFNEDVIDFEAKIEIEFEDRQREASFFNHRMIQTKTSIKTDREDKQSEALNRFESIVFSKLSRIRQREVLETTQFNRKKNSGRKFSIYENKIGHGLDENECDSLDAKAFYTPMLDIRRGNNVGVYHFAIYVCNLSRFGVENDFCFVHSPRLHLLYPLHLDYREHLGSRGQILPHSLLRTLAT